MNASPPKQEILTRNPQPVTDLRKDRLFVGSLGKAVQVLYAFGGQEAALTTTEIAGITKLNVSAVQRFTHTLTVLGLLEKDHRTKQFRLSVRLLDFAYLYLRSDALGIAAYPHLRSLSRATEEFVNLSVLDRADVIYVVRLAGIHGREQRDLVGGRMPSFLTSNGRIILAYLPVDEVRQILQSADRRPLTPASVTEPGKILRKIKAAREQGYCIVVDESELGVASIAAPVFDHTGRPRGAVSIAVDKKQWPVSRLREELAPPLMETARLITLAWSGTESPVRL